jgi:hypothetical protein
VDYHALAPLIGGVKSDGFFVVGRWPRSDSSAHRYRDSQDGEQCAHYWVSFHARHDSVRQLVLPHFLQASQAILTINIFDERPHDSTPLLVNGGRADLVLFQDCFVAIGKWFLEGNTACAKAARERGVLFD